MSLAAAMLPFHDQEPRPRRGRAAAVLGVCVLIALAGLAAWFVYARQGRLTAEKLRGAEERWRAAGIASYEARVSVTGNTSGSYFVQVREGRILRAEADGRPFERLEQARPWTIPGLFTILQEDLDRDAKPGAPAAYTHVTFDPDNGRLIRYVRSAANQNVAIAVEFTPQ